MLIVLLKPIGILCSYIFKAMGQRYVQGRASTTHPALTVTVYIPPSPIILRRNFSFTHAPPPILVLLHTKFSVFSLVIGSERSARRKKQKGDGGLPVDTPTVSLTAASMTDLDNITQHQIIYKKVNTLTHNIHPIVVLQGSKYQKYYV